MDSEIGLVNMRGRIYDPRLGRFIQADPIIRPGWSQGLSRYNYVNNNPLRWTDPSGFEPRDDEEEEDPEIGETVIDTTGAEPGYVVNADDGSIDLDPDAGEVDHESVDDGADNDNELAADEEAQVDDGEFGESSPTEGDPATSSDGEKHGTIHPVYIDSSTPEPIVVIGIEGTVSPWVGSPLLPVMGGGGGLIFDALSGELIGHFFSVSYGIGTPQLNGGGTSGYYESLQDFENASEVTLASDVPATSPVGVASGYALDSNGDIVGVSVTVGPSLEPASASYTLGTTIVTLY